ncbi:MAG: rRNA maturation RNase YbeY [Ruminococcus sp.]|nr:rRNA maturation RNase YbeY [Ruminococcus sp.]
MQEMKIVISDDNKTVKLQKGIRLIIRRCCKAVIHSEGIRGLSELFVTLTNDSGLSKFKEKYFSSDNDGVLILPSMENGVYPEDCSSGVRILGYMVISMEQVERNAYLYGRTIEREIAYLVLHGAFELFGHHYSHGAEKALMREKEEALLEQMGLAVSSSSMARKRA